MTKSIKIESLLPFVLAFLLPGLYFLNGNFFLKYYSLLELIPTWFSSSIFLLVLWYTNEWLGDKNVSFYYLIATFLNIGQGSVFLVIILYIIPKNLEISSWIFLFRVVFTAAVFIAIQQSLKSAKAVEKLKSENLSLKTQKYKAELDQLRKQVNPHFLFNSLSTLRTMIRNANPNSELFLMNLSSLYRQILQTHNQDYVSFEQEIKFLDAYIYLMQMRHEDALQIKSDINPKSYQYSIPIFALQILFENCIKHNIVSISKPLVIHIYQKNEVTVTVSNTYQPKQGSINSNGFGLSNLLERYKLLGIDNGLEIDKSDKHYKVSLKLL